MPSFEHTVDVNVPIEAAYQKWLVFEEYPLFMAGVKTVERVENNRMRWHAEIAGSEQDWFAQIEPLLPEERIAWRSITGPQFESAITFYRLDDQTTRIKHELIYNPEGFVDNPDEAVGIVKGRVIGDLRRFKEVVESEGDADLLTNALDAPTDNERRMA